MNNGQLVQENGTGHKQAIRPDDKTVLFSDERIRENAKRFGIDFENMTRQKASELQSKVDREPESEMAKAGVKEQALHVVMQKEEEESRKKDIEEQQKKDRPEPIDLPMPGLLSEQRMNENAKRFNLDFSSMTRQRAVELQSECDRDPEGDMAKAGVKQQATHVAALREQEEREAELQKVIPKKQEEQPEAGQDFTSEELLTEERMKENQERFGVNFKTMTKEEMADIQSEVDKNPSGDMAKAGLKEQAMHAVAQREIRNKSTKVTKDDTSKEVFADGHMPTPKERIDLDSQTAQNNQPEISYTANGQNGTSKPKRKPPVGFFEWIGRTVNSLYFSLCTVSREKTEA